MKGLLQRLAQRATGQASAVRSVVSLPFAAAPTLQPAETRRSFSEDLSEPSLPEQRLHASPMASAAPATRAPCPVADPEALLPEAQGTVEGSNRLDPAARQQSGLVDEPVGERPEADFSSANAILPARVEVAYRVTPEPLSSAAQAVITQPRSVARPLLPLRPAEPFIDPSTGVRDRLQTSQAIEDSIEVQISIGRIEVTAVQQAISAKTPALPAEKPMSLDDYLTRRGGAWR